MNKTAFRRAHSSCLRISAIALALFLLPQLVFAGGYCAIAYSKSTRRWGDSYRCNSRAQAESIALRKCGEPDAFVAGWGHNNYLALAIGSGTAWGTGLGSSAASAQRKALRACPSADARVIRYVYSFD